MRPVGRPQKLKIDFTGIDELPENERGAEVRRRVAEALARKVGLSPSDSKSVAAEQDR